MAVRKGATTRETREKEREEQKSLVTAAQNINYAKCLAANEKKTRDKSLKSLKKWLQHRDTSSKPLTEVDLMIIWKGLFYSMWMSDKPLIQEECAESISRLIHSLTLTNAMLFFKCGMQMFCNEWFGIDQWRIDKFRMMIRRFLRQCFVTLKKNDWNMKGISLFRKSVMDTVLHSSRCKALDLMLHFTDIYLEELSKVSEGRISETMLTEFLEPFVEHLSNSDDQRRTSHIVKHIFSHLIEQSKAAEEHSEKYKAWQKLGFPGSSIDVMEKECTDSENDSASEEEQSRSQKKKRNKNALDPRAGKIDVVLPRLQFDPKQIVTLLNKHKFAPGSTTKTRGIITKLIQDFTQLSKGGYPLGIKRVQLPKKKDLINVKSSAKELLDFEEELMRTDGVGMKAKMKKKRNNVKQESIPENLVKRRKKNEETSIPTAGKKRKAVDSFLENEYSKFEGILKMKSGTWFVFTEDEVPLPTPKKKKSKMTADLNDQIVIRSSPVENGSPRSTKRKKMLETETTACQQSDSKNNSPTEDLKKKLSPQKCNKKSLQQEDAPMQVFLYSYSSENFQEPQPVELKTPTKQLFSQTEWDTPARNGEVEFFVPSKKYAAKMRKLADQTNRNMTTLMASSANIRGKDREKLLPNPFSHKNGSMSVSPKKVKIDLRLNKSQEVHEHVACVKRSPAIPYDANRKPEKPLLKPVAVSSPINPFYRRKLSM